MIDFRKEVANCISKVVPSLGKEEIENLVEIPPNYDMGDYAFPCFRLAKEFKKAPNLIAEELAEKNRWGSIF